jgi:hypothetical protein
MTNYSIISKTLTEEQAEKLTDEEVEGMRKWLFNENIRIRDLEKSLEDERKLIDIQKGILENKQRKNMLLSQQLENQKRLFEQEWKIMEDEIRKVAVERDRLKHEREVMRDEAYRAARKSVSVSSNVKIFFKGVTDSASLKKRYKEITKIYHPDNMNGDEELVKAINQEYEAQKRYFIGT